MQKKMPDISIVIPVHNEGENLEWHYKKIEHAVKKLPITHEIIYIDDGSADNSLDIIKKLHDANEHVHYVSFSKNFGKEAALSAGFRKATGDAIFTLDADGQHPIELLGEFIKKWQEGYDVVSGIRESNQGEGFVKATGSKLFYGLLHVIDNSKETMRNSTDLRLIDRKVIDQYNLLTERNRITRNLIDWLGYKRTTISFNANERHAGKATYSFTKLVKLAIDGATKHSTRPLKLIGALGVIISFVSILLMLFLLVENYLLHDFLHLAVSGTAFLAMFLSFLIGIVLSCQGLLSLYIENVYYETQNRPLYIVREEE
jgi:dolichol-phosphate mannosyltransferase